MWNSSLTFIVKLLVVIFGFSLGIIVLELISRLTRPQGLDYFTKMENYECGEKPEASERGNIFFQYYKYAIAFTALDILTIYFIIFMESLRLLNTFFIALYAMLVLVFSLYVFVRAEYGG